MRARALLLLSALLAASPCLAAGGADVVERNRLLSILFATESRSFACETPFRILSAGGADMKVQSGQQVIFAPLVAADQSAGAFADLHSWLPMDAAFHARIKGRRFGDAALGEAVCGGVLDTAAGVYLPRAERRGDVARILLYVERAYGVKLDDVARQQLIGWDMRDPVDPEEAARAQRIDIVQGTDFGAPRRTLAEFERELRLRPQAKPPLHTKEILEQFDKRDYANAYVMLTSDLTRLMEAVSLQLLDGKQSAWDQVFEILVTHDMALRWARFRNHLELDPFAAKMFAFAVAADFDESARWSADCLLHLAPPGREHYDTAYPAFILQMAQVVDQRRWPTAQELRPELGPYRGLFLEAADARTWRDAVNLAANAYLAPESFQGPNPRLFAVEFTALTHLRKKYLPAQFSEPVHALQLLRSAQVPRPMIAGAVTELSVLRRAFSRTPPPLPALHQAILANDRAAFAAALRGSDIGQPDHLGESPLLLAAQWHRGDMVAALRAAGAEPPDASGILINAASAGQRRTVEHLLAAGVQPARHREHESAVVAAIGTQVDSVAIVRLLLAAGARPGSGESWPSWTFAAARTGDLARFEKLLELFKQYGMDMKQARALCTLSIQEDVQPGFVEVAMRLGASLEEGADSGSAPIFCAIESGKLATVKALVSAGASLAVRNGDGSSPSEVARERGHELIAGFLRRFEPKPQ